MLEFISLYAYAGMKLCFEFQFTHDDILVQAGDNDDVSKTVDGLGECTQPQKNN